MQTQNGRKALSLIIELIEQTIDIDLKKTFVNRSRLSFFVWGTIKQSGDEECIELNFQFMGKGDNETEIFAIIVDRDGLFDIIEIRGDGEQPMEGLFEWNSDEFDMMGGTDDEDEDDEQDLFY